MTDKISLGYNWGAEWDGETPNHIYLYFDNGLLINKKIRAYVELYGFAPQKYKVDCRADGGITCFLKPNIMLDIPGGFGITEKASEYYVAPGF